MAAVGDTLLDGRYAVLGVLGGGAQGETLEAADKRDGSVVAIKRFDVRYAKAWKDVELAEREARVLSELAHPALPRYLATFEDGGALCLVMERIEGRTLASLVASGERAAEADVIRFIADASDVLDYLHSRRPPIIHRDIKPGNVLRRPDGSHAFVDFGSVRDTLKPEGGSTVVGTFGFMAPEQFQGRALPASDVYAVGATALALLTGEDPSALPHRGLALDVPRALAGVASHEIIVLLSTLLAPDPDRRPGRIAPLLDSLRDASTHRARPGRADEPRTARPTSSRGEQRTRTRGRRGSAHSAAGPPAFIGFLLSIGVLVAEIVCFMLLRVAIPLVLSIVALAFGKSVARAGARVSRAGERAGHALARSRHWSMGASESRDTVPHPRVRVAPHGAVRVEAPGGEVETEGLEIEERDLARETEHHTERR